VECLRRMGDAARVMQRFTLGKGDIDDLLLIKQSVGVWKEIKRRIALERRITSNGTKVALQENWAYLDSLVGRISDFSRLETRIELAVNSRQIDGEKLSGEPEENGEEQNNTTPSAFQSQWRTTSQILEEKLIWSINPE